MSREKQQNVAAYDLSHVCTDALSIILLRVPVKDLLAACSLVSKQWNQILSSRGFWTDKMELDGYKLKWRRFTDLSINPFKCMALKHPFERNYIQDAWDLSERSAKCYKMDERWTCNRKIEWQPAENVGGDKPRIEAPPLFLDGQPEMLAELGSPVEACVAIGWQMFQKKIVLCLADEGLVDELMDTFRPTIVVSELVGNRRDCGSRYIMRCWLSREKDIEFPMVDDNSPRQYEDHNRWWPENEKEIAEASVNGRGGICIKRRFDQWQDEGWHLVEHKFKEYPAGMRFLFLETSGRNTQFWSGHYGVKMARCMVRAICESNDENVQNERAQKKPKIA